MARTPIPDHLIHKPEEVAENGRLFDEFCRLIPEEVIPIEPLWPLDSEELSGRDQVIERMVDVMVRAGKFEPTKELSREEKQRENTEYIEKGQREVVSQIASALIEEIRQKVEKEGEFRLPLGLVVTKAGKPSPVRAVLVSGQRKS